MAPAMPHTVWLAYRIGRETGSTLADHVRDRALERSRVRAPDPGQDCQPLQPSLADSHEHVRPVELDRSTHRPVIPLDHIQVTVANRVVDVVLGGDGRWGAIRLADKAKRATLWVVLDADLEDLGRAQPAVRGLPE